MTERSLFGVVPLIALLVLSIPQGIEAPTPRGRSDGTVVITENRHLGLPVSEFDSRINRYSPDGARNRYTTGGGRVFAEDGTYLGRLNANRYDPESVANPYGPYGSMYSSTSINNPYSAYGSRYSSQSATNPYTTTPPVVEYDDLDP